MRRIYIEFALSLAFLVTVSSSATATADDKNKEQPATTPDDVEPADETRDASVGFLHQPIPSTRAGRSITINGKMNRKWVIKRVVLACRWGSDGEWKEIQFRRSSTGAAVASIPADLVESPGVDYYIYLAPEEDGGEPLALFATRNDPYRVVVHGFSPKSRYDRRLAEWDGRLSRIDINYGYSNFGENLETIPPVTPGTAPETSNTDRGNVYHEVNIAYTYRFLTYLYAMRIEIAGLAHDFADFRPFTASKDEEIGPGMYAISPSLEFEFAKFFGMSLLLRLGISEEGFEGMRRLSAPGWFSHPSPGVGQLNVVLDVEKFNNGAHPWIVASIRSDQPREVIFAIHAAPDSAPIRSCILTATMGNYIRARHLWLRDRVVYSKTLWPDPVAAGVGPVGFTRPEFFEESSMSRLRDGSLIVLITTDEDDPSKVVAKPANWHYRGLKVTQYWRAYPHQEHPLRIRVRSFDP